MRLGYQLEGWVVEPERLTTETEWVPSSSYSDDFGSELLTEYRFALLDAFEEVFDISLKVTPAWGWDGQTPPILVD